MNSNLICPRCGGNILRFNPYGYPICNECGTRIQTESERDAEIKYERDLGMARQYLQVGDWNKAKKLIKPYCDTHPTDKRLYVMLLVAETKCYTDYLINNYFSRIDAAEYWDKLLRCGYVDRSMRTYARNRYNYINDMIEKISTKCWIAGCLAGILFIISGCLILAGEPICILWIVLTIIAGVVFFRLLIRKKDLSRLIDKKGNGVNDNPFGSDYSGYDDVFEW